MYTDISIHKLKLIINNINLIDVRDESVFKNEHIPNSINIPMYKLLSDPSFYLKSNVNYYIYCNSGISSVYVCKMLAKSGFNVVNVIGGFKEWKDSE